MSAFAWGTQDAFSSSGASSLAYFHIPSVLRQPVPTPASAELIGAGESEQNVAISFTECSVELEICCNDAEQILWQQRLEVIGPPHPFHFAERLLLLLFASRSAVSYRCTVLN